MRLLQLHSDSIEYQPIAKEIKGAEEIQSKVSVKFEDLVVAFVAVESTDDESVALRAVEEIKKYLDTVKCARLLLYPYAHLSSDLAPPAEARKVIRSLYSIAKQSLPDVQYAPFGWT